VLYKGQKKTVIRETFDAMPLKLTCYFHAGLKRFRALWRSSKCSFDLLRLGSTELYFRAGTAVKAARLFSPTMVLTGSSRFSRFVTSIVSEDVGFDPAHDGMAMFPVIVYM
jgi:hypothetical protein